ncbi:hypothetical protein ACKF11_01110 [Methylobacillus sp. Pita2]|jgi:hypothetical protein|uniref:hypothetical protein n=1 Tax=Methylobacillus sp. Pita2 TaxID=3383245 RepID=UPI0038B4B9F5
MIRITFSLAISIAALCGCVTTQGFYSVDAYDANGNKLNNVNLTVQGSGIYSARNALCQRYPQAKVIILDIKTNEELKNESPYQCQ